MNGGPSHDLFGLVGHQLEGKYTIEAAVARGGFGVVYRAVHEILQTRHAVKVLRIPEHVPPAAHAQLLDQFVHEARIVAQFQHPAVVRVTEFGVAETPTGHHAPWMALEWIEGETLGDHLNARRAQGGRTPRECFDLLQPVIDALAAAHEMGIAHRDIKPGNIMLTAAPSRGVRRGASAIPRARVLDFGIAKLMAEGEDGPVSGATRTHSLMPAYSPRYASPEQASGTRTGPWTDVHALGLVLTEMLTDQSPYDVSDKLKLTMQIMAPTRPTPARFGVDVGPWEPVLAKALAVTPADRYANAGELLAALEAEVPATAGRVGTMVLPHTEPLPMLAQGYTSAPSISMAPSAYITTLHPTTNQQELTTPATPRRGVIALALLLLASCAAMVFVASKQWRRPTPVAAAIRVARVAVERPIIAAPVRDAGATAPAAPVAQVLAPPVPAAAPVAAARPAHATVGIARPPAARPPRRPQGASAPNANLIY